MTTIEDRISITQSQVANVVAFLENELDSRVVYVRRAVILVGIATSALEVMAQLEALAVPSDFDGSWFDLRNRVATAKHKAAAIIAGSDVRASPCGVPA